MYISTKEFFRTHLFLTEESLSLEHHLSFRDHSSPLLLSKGISYLSIYLPTLLLFLSLCLSPALLPPLSVRLRSVSIHHVYMRLYRYRWVQLQMYMRI